MIDTSPRPLKHVFCLFFTSLGCFTFTVKSFTLEGIYWKWKVSPGSLADYPTSPGWIICQSTWLIDCRYHWVNMNSCVLTCALYPSKMAADSFSCLACSSASCTWLSRRPSLKPFVRWVTLSSSWSWRGPSSPCISSRSYRGRERRGSAHFAWR